MSVFPNKTIIKLQKMIKNMILINQIQQSYKKKLKIEITLKIINLIKIFKKLKGLYVLNVVITSI
jgi:hypothetical protein